MRSKSVAAMVVGVLAISALPIRPAAAVRPAARILLSTSSVLFSRAVTIRVTGLHPGEAIVVRNEADTSGMPPLSSQGVFRANSNGVVDVRRAQSESGTYVGRDRMGLFWSLRPADPGPYPLFPEPLPRVETDRVSVEIAGKTVAHRRLVRQLMAPGVTEHQLRPERDGVYGDYFAPSHPSGRASVLVFGGSE